MTRYLFEERSHCWTAWGWGTWERAWKEMAPILQQ